jgi:DNA-binding response OmpR family regulator
MNNLKQNENKSATKLILIAEDETGYANLLAETFIVNEFIVEVTKNGTLAIEGLRSNRPEVLILDLLMPEKDGYTLLKEIRADKILKDIIVIVLTNVDQENSRTRALELGANEYLIKSHVSMEEVVEIVNKQLNMKSQE